VVEKKTEGMYSLIKWDLAFLRGVSRETPPFFR